MQLSSMFGGLLKTLMTMGLAGLSGFTVFEIMKAVYKGFQSGTPDVSRKFIEANIAQVMNINPPRAVFQADWPGGKKADLGNELKPSEVANQPNISYPSSPNDLYTVVLTDIDSRNPQDPNTVGSWTHWVVYNVPGTETKRGSILYEYVGSLTPKDAVREEDCKQLKRHRHLITSRNNLNIGKTTEDSLTRFHRYVLLAYRQPGTINPTETPKKRSDAQRFEFNTGQFATNYGLGTPVAGNYYRAQHESPFVDEQMKAIFAGGA